MEYQKTIQRLRQVAFLLFIFATTSIVGSLWLHNTLVSFNFDNTHGHLVGKLDLKPGDSFELLYDCDPTKKTCVHHEKHKDLLFPKIATLTPCFENELGINFRYGDKKVELNDFLDDLNPNKKLDNDLFVIVTIKDEKDKKCIINSEKYKFYKIFPFYHELIYKLKKNIDALATAEKVNPFIYGETSISNMVKRFPINFIFKGFLYFSVILMIIYWSLYNNLFKNILKTKKNFFFFFGIGSAIFLFFHVLFLGMEIDNKIFNKMRSIILLLFILFEVIAQTILTKKLYQNTKTLENFCFKRIIKLKLYFIILIVIVTFISLLFLIFSDLPKNTENILEWNYFVVLLFFYMLSYLMWKKKLTFYPSST